MLGGALLTTTETYKTIANWEKGEPREYGDRMMRALILEYVEGSAKLKALIDEITTMDRVIQDTMIFTESGHGCWAIAA
jgi:hypothetical protein